MDKLANLPILKVKKGTPANSDGQKVSNSHYGKGQALLALTVVETSRIQSENEPQYRFLCLVGASDGRKTFVAFDQPT